MANKYKFNEIASEIDDIREKINRSRNELKKWFISKDELIDLMYISTAAQEPMLFVGPPGTGKSELVIKFCETIQVPPDKYFEYMLTKFTEPSEIIGPVDIKRLKDGEYHRNTKGKIPEATIVFLDEIFKSNSAILNTLLTIINERKFYQDGKPCPVKMKMLFAATNEISLEQELAALRDRFILKAPSFNIWQDIFHRLIRKGIQGEMYRALEQKPWRKGEGTIIEDFIKLKSYYDEITRRQFKGEGKKLSEEIDFPEHEMIMFHRIINSLAKDLRIEISDRKIIKLVKLIRIRALLFHGGEVRPDDLSLLRYIGNSIAEMKSIRNFVDDVLNLS